MKYDNLHKENFWNHMEAMHPVALKKFTDWIDQYKIDNDWENLFAPGIKFHDIPIELQTGIWIKYATQEGCSYDVDLVEWDLEEEIMNHLAWEEQALSEVIKSETL